MTLKTTTPGPPPGGLLYIVKTLAGNATVSDASFAGNATILVALPAGNATVSVASFSYRNATGTVAFPGCFLITTVVKCFSTISVGAEYENRIFADGSKTG